MLITFSHHLGARDAIERDGDRIALADPGDAEAAQANPVELLTARINSVVWATGFRYDLGWVHLSVFDDGGEPVHRRGVTRHPGVYFLGLRFLHTLRSGFVFGGGGDAAYLTQHIVSRP
jgi:hypothetical protein